MSILVNLINFILLLLLSYAWFTDILNNCGPFNTYELDEFLKKIGNKK